MNKQSKTILIIVFVIFIGIVIFGVISRKSKLNNFSDNGIETTATITDVIKKRDRNVSGRRRVSNILEVTYFTQNEKPDSVKNEKTIEKDEDGNYTFNFNKLKVGLGEYIKTEIDVSSSQLNKFKKGDKVQILYLPDDPYDAILKEDLE